MRSVSRRASVKLLSLLLSLVLGAAPVLQGAGIAAAATVTEDLSAATTSAAPRAVVRELEGERTETSRAFLLSDGTVHAEVPRAAHQLPR
ncbi:MAG: hypothetical protein WBI63_06415 [Coriobacteriia bacterium]